MWSGPCTCARVMPLLQQPVLLLRLFCAACPPASQVACCLVVNDACRVLHGAERRRWREVPVEVHPQARHQGSSHFGCHPAGIRIFCTEERTQGKNREKAMSVLRSRLFEMEREKQAAEVAANRRSQVSAAVSWCQAHAEGILCGSRL